MFLQAKALPFMQWVARLGGSAFYFSVQYAIHAACVSPVFLGRFLPTFYSAFPPKWASHGFWFLLRGSHVLLLFMEDVVRMWMRPRLAGMATCLFYDDRLAWSGWC